MKKLFPFVALLWPLALLAQYSITTSKEYCVIDTVKYEIMVEQRTYITEQGNAQVMHYGPAVAAGIANNNYEGDLKIHGSIEYKDTLLIVEEIKGSAFHNCSGITSVTIPREIRTIGAQAFRNCTALRNIYIDDGCEIGKMAFDNTAWFDLQEDGIVYLAKAAYAYKGVIPENGSIVIKDGTLSIAGGAFDCSYPANRQAKELISITIPNSVTSIGSVAFGGCSKLSEISIPSSIKSIGNDAFSGCGGLTGVYITDFTSWCEIKFPTSQYPESNPLYYAHHLYLNEELVTHVKIPVSVGTIGMTFNGASDIVSVQIPETCTRITNLAFEGCMLEAVLTKNVNTSINNGGFSQRSMRHAMLYIPEGTWSNAVYESDWYIFDNIREVAMDKNNLSAGKAYCLMDSESFGYMVYDDASRTTKSVTAFYSIDESDPVNSWQIVENEGKIYLYNIGAKKYATFIHDGTVVLNDSPRAIDFSDGQNGIKIGNKEWYFVLNKNVSVDKDLTNVKTISTFITHPHSTYYSLNGCKIENPQKGLNIIRMSNGKTQKVVVK